MLLLFGRIRVGDEMEIYPGSITDCDGKRFLIKEFRTDDIISYKQHLLTVGASGSFLPMHFIASATGLTAYYRIDGFVAFPEWLAQQDWLGEVQAAKLCGIFSQILRRLLEAEDLFLDLEDLILDSDSVFMHTKERYVKLAFESRAGYHQPLQRSFLALLNSTTSIIDDEQWSIYSEEILRQSKEENWGLTGILKKTTEQSRYILERKWPERENFRAGAPGQI